jgi:excisionase family DNA binding protein
MEQNIERLAYSIQEAATAIGISSRVVHDFVKKGSLAHFRVGARVLIPVDELKAFIEPR